ncbi:hypothetical protein [Mangrovihabitans endophyticus]|uniref:Uncharacterized protein n=1 Tax=Mangrovihabitans endophyticus TaxID=1751298 RepID=A0A8J3BS21_9ACTN|nr:hypothetical protein [Mangrovihabitans endophyticus]GGK72476.1 hypothetical protein GCM10012284_02840 [Mangrovihabitans endophyticus]
MTDDSAPLVVEPMTILVCAFHVRRDDRLDSLADDIVALLEPDGTVLDLSRFDRRADVVELRKIDRRPKERR